MLGVHVNWTAPFAVRRPDAEYALDPLELLTSTAAALFWRKQGGEMVLYTDSRGVGFYREVGVVDAYDHIDVSCLDAYTARCGVDPALAPCVARMHVLGSIPHPFVAMDLDFVLADPGCFPYREADLCCLHWELPTPPWYPPFEEQFIPEGFPLPTDLDFATLVPNIAFLYVAVPEFFRSYAALAESYAIRSVEANANVPPNRIAIFADQRLMGMLASKHGLIFQSLLNDMWTCGPHGRHWEALRRKRGMGVSDDPRNLIAPFWVVDRGRFDERKESVDYVHLWFEKAVFSAEDQHAPGRSAVLRALVERTEREFAHAPVWRRLKEWLSASGANVAAWQT
ncbi:MAG: hypothetical protein HY718_04940 [Planctomycetes bacterium]|nr:hypothetical protein [Planctomycetota bacterium]